MGGMLILDARHPESSRAVERDDRVRVSRRGGAGAPPFAVANRKLRREARPLIESLRAGLALAVAAIACFLAAWTLLPAPSYALLTLGVGAPEVGVWIGVLGAFSLVLALAGGRRASPAAWATVLLSVAAIGLALHPLVRFRAVARRFEAAEREALGGDPLARLPAQRRAAMRRAPLVAREMFVGIPAGDAVVERGIRVAAPGGVPLTADVYRPRTGEGHPVLVQVYGGAWQRGEPGRNPVHARWLAARGWVVVAVDYRHAPRWTYPAQIEDLRAMLAWVRTNAARHGGDASRLALLGRSAGGQLALLAAYTTAPDVPPPLAVVSLYGPTDLEGGYREPPSPDPMDVRSLISGYLGGTPDARPEVYREASPVSHADRPQPPTLLVHGTRDNVVEARWGRALHARLRAAGNTSLYQEIPWADHGFDVVSFGPSGQLALWEVERFLEWAVRRGP